MKYKIIVASLCMALFASLPVQAAENYVIDTQKHHAFIQFKVKHLGYSWLLGRFDTFTGTFTYDAKHPEKNSVKVIIDTASINSNHAKRDKHLRSADFFDVGKYPTATFESTGYMDKGHGKGIMKGVLHLHGVAKKLAIDVDQVGTGPDPWGGYRRGFEGHTTLHLSDYHMPFAPKLGPVSEDVELYLSIEGIRQ